MNSNDQSLEFAAVESPTTENEKIREDDPMVMEAVAVNNLRSKKSGS